MLGFSSFPQGVCHKTMMFTSFVSCESSLLNNLTNKLAIFRQGLNFAGIYNARQH